MVFLPTQAVFTINGRFQYSTLLTQSPGRQSAAIFNRLHAIYQSTGRTIAFLLHAASGRVYRPHQISITGSSTQYIINHQYIITSMQSCSVLSSNFSHGRHLQNAAVSRRNQFSSFKSPAYRLQSLHAAVSISSLQAHHSEGRESSESKQIPTQQATNTNRSLLLCIHTVFKIITGLSPTQPARTQQEKIGFRVPWKGRSFKNVQRYQQPPKDFTSRRHGF